VDVAQDLGGRAGGLGLLGPAARAAAAGEREDGDGQEGGCRKDAHALTETAHPSTIGMRSHILSVRRARVPVNPYPRKP
jgi:hypothetical protein